MTDRKEKEEYGNKKIIEYLENEKRFLVEIKRIFHECLWAVIWWKKISFGLKLQYCVYLMLFDEIALEIPVMKLQEAILFECLCFNTRIINILFLYFLRIIFCYSFAFREINAYGLNCLYCFTVNMGKFHKKS